MTWTTIEHLLNHDQAVERVAERINNSPLLLEWIDDRAYDEWNGVNDPEDLAEGVINQLYVLRVNSNMSRPKPKRLYLTRHIKT